MNVSTLSPEDCRALVSKMAPRQQETLAQYLLCGSSKGAAKEMGISIKTVEAHLSEGGRRMGVVFLPHKIVIAVKAGLV